MAGAEGLEPSARGFGDRCSTNWAIPLNKKCCVVSLAHLQEIWYHRHAVLSSVFQHKNADLSKNLYCRVWYARHAHFIQSKITCDRIGSRTSLSWILTAARSRFLCRKSHAFFQLLRCDWVIKQLGNALDTFPQIRYNKYRQRNKTIIPIAWQTPSYRDFYMDFNFYKM